MKGRTTIQANKWFFALLGLSLLFFLIKGLHYVTIGSYLPIVIPVLLLLLLFTLAAKPWRRLIRTWGVLLILWGLSRLIIELLFQFAPLTETHIREQFTVIQKLISLISVGVGYYLIKRVKQVIEG